ncbi:uncharacterized protein BXZ73DRAFT_75106 [Epithele typhae]|uniref:uncharacterized protein n=1 Tax=Epithele typhae TaxID=378194 RepID=UPI002007F1AA|nr:uncharacterized protein BXZ73DRAFT_75106 [Epithele typhae]KAH9941137.1 hypothetical protein BXZ73DRAFT_75106 [Epithele typhae]
MPPSKKNSSASAATRKKHARKAAAAQGTVEEPQVPKEKKPKGKDKKAAKKEPQKKVYIPPVKPTPAQPDPLDTLGLAQKLPPELSVILRLLAKKDATTKRRALEDLQTAWIARAKRGDEPEYLLYNLEQTIPVWLHHVPALFFHPSRRIRLQAVALHASILDIRPLRQALFFQIREVLSSDHAESVLGSWCLAVHDVDRQVSSYARESWARYVSTSESTEGKLLLDAALFPRLWDFVYRTLLDPLGVYLYINPPQTAIPTLTPSRKGSGRGTPVRKDDEPVGRAKAEEDEEKEQDRKARLRVSAFGATEWVLNVKSSRSDHPLPSEAQDAAGKATEESFWTVFANPALWSSLYSGKTPPFVDAESFGYEQPVVRRRAILRSAWVEMDNIVRSSMWQPLLLFLKAHPKSWILEATPEKDEDEDEDEDEDGGSGDEGEESQPQLKPAEPQLGQSHAYNEFLQFLATGCSGSPVQGYPTVLIILSTIPSAIIALSSEHPLEVLFASFWSAVDARVLNSLDRVAASAAFLSSLLECLVFVTRRIINSQEDEAVSLIRSQSDQQVLREEAVNSFVREQIKHFWEDFTSGTLKVSAKKAGTELGKTFITLHKLHPPSFEAGWSVVTTAVQAFTTPSTEAIPLLIPDVLQALTTSMEKGTVPGDAATVLVLSIVGFALDQCAAVLKVEEVDAARVASLVNIFHAFGEVVFTDPQVAKGVDDLVQGQTNELLHTMPSLVILYLQHRQDQVICSSVWHQVLKIIDSPDDVKVFLPLLLDAAEDESLPDYLRPQDEGPQRLIASLLSEALSGPPGTTGAVLVRRLLISHKYFVSDACSENSMRSLVLAFSTHVDSALREEKPSVASLTTPLTLLRDLVKNGSSGLLLDSASAELYPYIYLLAFLMPQVCTMDETLKKTAQGLWDEWAATGGEAVENITMGAVKQLLRDLMADFVACPTPGHILRMVATSPYGASINVLAEIFPSRDEIDRLLTELPPAPLDASLAVVDPLVPPPTQFRAAANEAPDCDNQGFSVYARVVHGLLLHLADDRQTAKTNFWALHHFLALAIYAEDEKHLPALQSPVFSQSVSRATLQNITDRTLQIATYLLSSFTEETWHADVTKVLLGQGSAERLDGAGKLIVDLISNARTQDTVRESRVLHMILHHVLNTATKADAEQWMAVARRLERQAPHTALAMIFSITRYAPEPTRLDRLRNELAAGIMGIPVSKANTEGLWLLRNLAASAPDPESDIVYLPQLRAVNFMKACQQWITSDEDLEEDVHTEMTLVFASIVPILSNVPGGHWDLMFDVMENNLENASLDDSTTFVALARSLQLFMVIEDFAASTRTLREIWEERKSSILTLIRDLIALKLDAASSAPLSTCRELALQIVQNLPTSLLTRETLRKMCHLVLDSSVDVQRMAYQLLQEAAKKYTEELVIEAAVDTEETIKVEIPSELLDILQRSPNHEDMNEYGQEWFGYLLAWMVTFDLFLDASLKVKSGYIDQLRDLDLVGARLLPTVFGILDLYGGMAKAFKVDIWDVDEYYLDFYSAETSLSQRLLTAHLYYRALLLVPSLLSTVVATYTSRHFSPAIIRTELARRPAGENVTVKVAAAVHEATAAYAVDEQRLELTVKLPVDWPLHTIEIRVSKLVGVAEDRWRAWVLGVQLILTFRSGSIVDGLSFFLKNVSSHFEGVAECAICYSLVNATDGSLPRKPCKTCKNRFHAACLYKWFNTSHSSSCPLCRSEIMTGK